MISCIKKCIYSQVMLAVGPRRPSIIILTDNFFFIITVRF